MDSIVDEEVSFKLFDHVNGIEYVACTSSIPIITGTDYVELYLEHYDYAVVLDFANTVTQVIELAAGTTYVSFNVETDLNAVKAALVAALPGATNILIQGKNQNTKYNGRRWNGQLTALDLAQMYIIQVEEDSEISLEGMAVDPAMHPATIANGANYIAYPFNASMTVTNAFAGFAVNNDIVQSKNQNAKYNGRRWNGQLTELTPGQGYIYNSASSDTRTFVYPAPAKSGQISDAPAKSANPSCSKQRGVKTLDIELPVVPKAQHDRLDAKGILFKKAK